MSRTYCSRPASNARSLYDEAMPNARLSNYNTMVTLVALGWLQGANYGDHERLSLVEDAFDELRAAL